MLSQPSAFDRETMIVNGIRIGMRTAGTGDPLVYWHGARTVPDSDFALAWAAERRVIAPYHPGWGDSVDPIGFTDMHDYVMHYLDWFDQMRFGAVDLVGFSLGGWMAAQFAAEHRPRVRKLVLIAPAGLNVPDYPTVDFYTLAPEEIPAYLAVNPSVIEMPQPPDAAFLALAEREMASTAPFIQGHPYSEKLNRWLHRVTMPVLLVWGEQDRLIPAKQAEAWRKLIPHAEVHMVSGAGHLVMLEKPETAAKIAEFLRK